MQWSTVPLASRGSSKRQTPVRSDTTWVCFVRRRRHRKAARQTPLQNESRWGVKMMQRMSLHRSPMHGEGLAGRAACSGVILVSVRRERTSYGKSSVGREVLWSIGASPQTVRQSGRRKPHISRKVISERIAPAPKSTSSLSGMANPALGPNRTQAHVIPVPPRDTEYLALVFRGFSF